MKRTFIIGLFMFSSFSLLFGIAPYIQIAEFQGSVEDARETVTSVLKRSDYKILGEYQPGNIDEIYVLAFTSQELIELCQRAANQGMFAAAMKVGFQKEGSVVKISVLNPEYLFYAYFRDLMEDADFQSIAISLSDAIKSDLKEVGDQAVPFGGDEKVKDLIKYRYMAGMPNFEKQVELAEFASFGKGVAHIRESLKTGKGNTVKVYEIVDEQAGIAVFGVGLSDPEKGESHFLPIIGESHVAAMPYELILEHNKASMLHGRFRFAVHWPELTMGTFTKIMSSPGDVEDALKSLME